MMRNFFNDETLGIIEALAKVFYTEEEVARYIGIEWEQFKKEVKNTNSNVHKRYYSGWMQSDFELRKLILNSAIAGSTPAQNLILDIRKKAFVNRLK